MVIFQRKTIYGGVVVQQFPLWGLGLGLALLVAASLWTKIGVTLGRVALPLALIAIAIVFWLGHEAGVAAATALTRVFRCGQKEDAKPPAGSPLASGDLIKGCYRLLLHNQDRLSLVHPFKGIAAADLPVLIIPWDQASAITHFFRSAAPLTSWSKPAHFSDDHYTPI